MQIWWDTWHVPGVNNIMAPLISSHAILRYSPSPRHLCQGCIQHMAATHAMWTICHASATVIYIPHVLAHIRARKIICLKCWQICLGPLLWVETLLFAGMGLCFRPWTSANSAGSLIIFTVQRVQQTHENWWICWIFFLMKPSKGKLGTLQT